MLKSQQKEKGPRGTSRALIAGIIVGALIFATRPADAQGANGATPEQILAFLDTDGDGKVGLQDYLRFQQPRHAQFDADGDGILSEKEFRESLQGDGKRNSERSFKAFNNEESRKGLTQREFLGYHAYVFNNFVDLNKDGFVSVAEWTKVVGE